MKGLKIALVLSFLVALVAVLDASLVAVIGAKLALADTVPTDTDQNKPAASSEDARFMLGGNLGQIQPPEHDSLGAGDFEWKALTKNGPASGANPVVGSNAKPYYDFKDGQPFPYYVVPSK